MPYNPSAIYDLLRNAFSDEAFQILCYDYFRLVYEQFTAGMTRSQHIQLLIEACARDQQFDHLLALVKEANPAQYAKYEPSLPDLAYRSVDPAAPQRRDFYAHEPLPRHYVARAELLDNIRALLLSNKVDVVLHGMGGLGKTVLARALCDDPEIQNTFYGGILWARLSQQVTEEDLKAKLADWVRTLGGTISETAPSLDKLRNMLHELMKNRACLLIVDNVWQRRHLEVFRVDTPNSRLLVTTREADIGRNLEVEPVSLPLMQNDEAIALLEEWSTSVRWLDAQAKNRIIQQLGYHPLAIKLTGNQLQDYDSLEAWLAEFKATELEEMSVEAIHDSLSQTFNLSFNKLNDNQRELYNSLAIFRTDETIPVVAIRRLWAALESKKPSQVRKLLRHLASRALFDLQDDEIILHDLLREFMIDDVAQDDILSAHTALLDSYRQPQTGDDWHTVPDDDYLYDHLAYHLDAIADDDPTAATDLKQLFANDAWLHVRVPQSNYEYDGYIADLMLAWAMTHNQCLHQIDMNQPPMALIDCVRYALIRTSINSLAANYAPALVARSVETGLWSLDRALSIATKVREAERQAWIYNLLLTLERLTPAQHTAIQKLALEATLAIDGYEVSRVHALIILVPELNEVYLQKAIDYILTLQDDLALGIALLGFDPYLDKAYLKTLGQKTSDPALRHSIEAKLAWRARQDVDPTTTKTSIELQPEDTRAEAIAEQETLLSQEPLQIQLKNALKIGDDRQQALALVALSTDLKKSKQAQALAASLQAVLAIADEGEKAWTLSELGQHLDEELLKNCLTALLAVEDESVKAEPLGRLASMLNGSLLEQALNVALSIEDDEYRGWALVGFGQYLTKEQIRKQFTSAMQLPKERSRATALSNLAMIFDDELLEQGWATALAIKSEKYKARALAGLIPRMNVAMVDRALTVALAMSDESARSELLSGLTPYLTGKAFDQAWDAALGLTDEVDRAVALLNFGPQLQDEALAQCLAATLDLNYAKGKASILAAIASQLNQPQLEQGLEATLQLTEPNYQLIAIPPLGRYLDEPAKERALAKGVDAILSITYEADRARNLSNLLPQLSAYPHLLSRIRDYIPTHLWHLQYQKREDALTFLSTERLFSSALLSLSGENLAQIAETVGEICDDWEWL